MARAGRDFEQFNMNANVGGGFASTPFDDGGASMAAAQVFARLGNQLGQLADRAAVRNAQNAASAAGEAAIGLPSIEAVTKTEKAPALPQDPGDVVYDPLTGKQRLKKPVEAVQNPDAPKPASGGGGKGGGKGLGSVAQKAALARGYFEKLGYAPHQAAGIVGNLIQESTLRTSVVGDKNIPGGSVGIGQWNRERKAALMNFAAKRGTPWHDFETQLAFVHHELTTSEKSAGDAVRRARTLDEATAGMISFERPMGWSPGNPRGGHGWNNRLRYAQQVLGGTADGSLPATVAQPIASGVPVIPQAPLADVTSTTLHYKIPAPKPLALRNDGTLAGDAYDARLQEVAGWRMTAGLDAAMTQAYTDNAQDPAAFAKSMKEIGETYVKQAESMGPEMKQAIAKRVMNHAETFVRDVNAKAEQKAEGERKVNALAALDAEQALIERQAYALGAAADGDAKLQTLATGALARIDQAAASGAITPADAFKARERTLQTLTVSRIKGVFDALETPEQKSRFADGLMQQWADKNSPLSAIPLANMESLVNGLQEQARVAQRAIVATNAFDKARFSRLVKDDIASMEKTGTGLDAGGQPLDFDTVAKALGEDRALEWLADKEDAKAIHTATAGLEKMTPEQLDAHLAEVEPEPGEAGFEAKQKAHEAAVKKANAVLKQRAEDPAQAAEDAFPDVAKEKDPFARAQARMDAQGALGIPRAGQNVLTRAEAQQLSGRIEMAEDNPDLLQTELESLMGEVQKAYGPLADEVMGQVLHERGIDKATATLGAGLLQQLRIGQPPRASELRLFGMVKGIDQANSAMDGPQLDPKVKAGSAPMGGGARGSARPAPAKPGERAAARARVPNAKSVAFLRENPETAAQFDARFGEGVSAQYLEDRGPPLRRKLANGAIELTYPDGWIETLNPDGSVDGRPAP